ncbi:GTP-binding protein Di-Ras2 [Paragonimus heterotremus]|uniref:GTP-binding protein Di-Ras2 n=1 Tax=Paragonimus heterotremus TaxID=100268 RepID=A0A8J4X295_9TREM|nr:GTP-binding protein Di-Ras2 [Paragonimus heterotremus]
MPEQPTDYRVVLFGSGGVGKTSLVLRFVRGTFRETYVPTIEDTYRQVISCNKQVCTLQITDTTGSHQFPAMQRLSISKGHAFILVYSITNKSSFDELQPLYNELTVIKREELIRVPVMLVGNKADEAESREVSATVGKALAQKWKCGFMETSAKANMNVKEVFQELLRMETRQNMTLMGEVKQRTGIFRLFRRRYNTSLNSESTFPSVASDYSIEASELPRQLNTLPIPGSSKENKPSRLRSFWRQKSQTNQTVRSDNGKNVNGDT